MFKKVYHETRCCGTSHNASSTNSPRAASTSATAAPAIIHSSGQTILENNNNLNNNNNNAFENNIRPATPVASSSSSSSQYQTKMMNTWEVETLVQTGYFDNRRLRAPLIRRPLIVARYISRSSKFCSSLAPLLVCSFCLICSEAV